MTTATKQRQLKLANLQEVVAELDALDGGPYQQTGNWKLGQICRHLSLDLRSSIEGYPKFVYLFAPLRPLVRWILLPKILRFDSPTGIRTASQYVPPDDVSDEQGRQEYREQIERFLHHEGRYHTHPGFGFSDRENLERIYAAHASHHLSFLLPEKASGDAQQ